MAMHADAASEALASGSVDDLIAGLRTCLSDHAGFPDERDVMLDFAPFFDAADRLGALPHEVFDAAAHGQPADVHDLAERFGRRIDVTLAAFGWHLDDEEGKLRYRFSWPAWVPPKGVTGATERRPP